MADDHRVVFFFICRCVCACVCVRPRARCWNEMQHYYYFGEMIRNIAAVQFSSKFLEKGSLLLLLAPQ